MKELEDGEVGKKEIGGEKRKERREGGEIERRMEMKERKERRKNLVIRGLEVKEGKRRKAVEDILKEIGVEAKIKEIWRITAEREKGREAVGIKVEETEKRGEIWEKKKKLKRRKERILEGRLDIEEEEDEMEIGGDSKGGREERKEDLDKV